MRSHHLPTRLARNGAARQSELIYGLRAVNAVLVVRPHDAIELLFDPRAERDLTPVVEQARAKGVRVTRSNEQELRSITSTHNHEGIALFVAPRRWTPAKDLVHLLGNGRGTAIALDRVRNAYNIGAILRSAAFFGIDAVLFGSRAPEPDLPEDAVRVAEGGAEHLALSRTTDLAKTLEQLRESGVQIVGAESDGATSAIGFSFAPKSVLVFGHERDGISRRVRAQCDAIVAIRGSGAIESLNVAIAASLMISELVRDRIQAHTPARAPSPAMTMPSSAQPSRTTPGPARPARR